MPEFSDDRNVLILAKKKRRMARAVKFSNCCNAGMTMEMLTDD